MNFEKIPTMKDKKEDTSMGKVGKSKISKVLSGLAAGVGAFIASGTVAMSETAQERIMRQRAEKITGVVTPGKEKSQVQEVKPPYEQVSGPKEVKQDEWKPEGTSTGGGYEEALRKAMKK